MKNRQLREPHISLSGIFDAAESDCSAVVERRPAIDLDPGLVDPAEAGRLDQHQDTVPSRIEPGG